MKSKRGKATLMGALAVVAGMISVGCATDEPDPHYAEYEESVTITEPSGAEPAAISDQEEMVIPIHEEQLKVGKREVDSGQVTLRKVVKTETVSQPVELRKENLVIERRGIASDPGATSELSSNFGAPFEEKTVTIQLQSEEPVVETETVTTGEVVARKNVEWDRQTVQRDLRREDVSVDGQTPGTTIEEAAGAEAQPAPREDSDRIYDDEGLDNQE